MMSYVLRRIAATVPVLAFVGLFVFFLLRLTPGDPAILIAGDQATTQQIASIRAQLGLDKPLTEQLLAWATQLAQGNLGRSVFSDMAVTRLIGMRIEPTAMLTLVAILMALAIALPLGILSALKAGSRTDRAVMAFAMVGFSSPVFVVAFLLVYVFALSLGWFPTQGYVPLSQGLLPCLNSLVLPGWRSPCSMRRYSLASCARACSRCCRRTMFVPPMPRA